MPQTSQLDRPQSRCEDAASAREFFTEYFGYSTIFLGFENMKSCMLITIAVLAIVFQATALPMAENVADLEVKKEGRSDLIDATQLILPDSAIPAARYLFDKINEERIEKGIHPFMGFVVKQATTQIQEGVVFDIQLEVGSNHNVNGRVINTFVNHVQNGIESSEDSFELVYFAVDKAAGSTEADVQMHYPALGLLPKTDPSWDECVVPMRPPPARPPPRTLPRSQVSLGGGVVAGGAPRRDALPPRVLRRARGLARVHVAPRPPEPGATTPPPPPPPLLPPLRPALPPRWVGQPTTRRALARRTTGGSDHPHAGSQTHHPRRELATLAPTLAPSFSHRQHHPHSGAGLVRVMLA